MVELIIGAVVAALAGLGIAYQRGRANQRQDTKTEVLERVNKHAEERREIDESLARNGASAADRLRDGYSRD